MAWYDTNWTYRVKATIQSSKVGSDQTDITLMVDLADLPADFHTNVATDGADIRVTKSDGTTELPRHVEFYTAASDLGEMWFKYSGTLSASADTDVYIYYGNGTATDYAEGDTYGKHNIVDSNIQAMYICQDGLLDVTSNSNDLTHSGTANYATALINKGVDYGSASSDRAANTAPTNMPTSGDLTVSMWLRPDGTAGNQRYIGQSDATPGTTFWNLIHLPGIADLRWQYRGTASNQNLDYGGTIGIGSWYHVVATIDDGTTQGLYVNNVGTTRTPEARVTTSNSFAIGRMGAYDADYTEGLIDNVMISNVARGTGWIATTYNNQGSPAAFYSYAAQEAWYQIGVSSNVALSESVAHQVTFNRSASSNIALSDSLTSQELVVVLRTIATETMAITDTGAERVFNTSRVLESNAAITETIDRVANLDRELASALGLTDTLTSLEITLIQVALSDSLGITDNFAQEVRKTKTNAIRFKDSGDIVIKFKDDSIKSVRTKF